MKKFLFSIIFLATTALHAGVFDAGGYLFYGDTELRSVWAYASSNCVKQGMIIASYDVVASLKDTPEFREGVQGIDYYKNPFWTDRLGFAQAVALWRTPIAVPLIKESVISVLCMSGSAPVSPPVTPHPPIGFDQCNRYTEHGVSACLQNSSCEWSSDSRKCYSKKGFECPYYTQHGVTACLNNTTTFGLKCEWASGIRACYQKTGYSCEWYTRYGVTACLQSSNRCEWSSTSHSCYTK